MIEPLAGGLRRGAQQESKRLGVATAVRLSARPTTGAAPGLRAGLHHRLAEISRRHLDQILQEEERGGRSARLFFTAEFALYRARRDRSAGKREGGTRLPLNS